MSKLKQIKIPISLDLEETPSFNYNYKLVRLGDGLIKTGYIVKYVEWEGGIGSKAKSLDDNISIEKSLVLDPGMYYAWLTTPITKIIEQKEDYIKFETENSTYELFKNK